MVVVNETNASDVQQMLAEHDDRILNCLAEDRHMLGEKLDQILNDAIILRHDDQEADDDE